MNKAEKALCQEILAYLVRRPNTEDTLEGITKWWLLERRIQEETARVQRALDSLVAWGLLISHRGSDGNRYYRRSPRQNDLALAGQSM